MKRTVAWNKLNIGFGALCYLNATKLTEVNVF